MAKTKTPKTPKTKTPVDPIVLVANREEWLTKLAEELIPVLADKGATMEGPLRLTCGWPARGALSRKRQRIGECWAPAVSTDGANQIFISPVLVDAVTVAGVVAHEMIHAAGKRNHQRGFAVLAEKIGLEGPATATVPGPAFIETVTPILERLGAYPHAAMNPSINVKKQTTRLLKVVCPAPENHEGAFEDGSLDYIVRMSAKVYEVAPPKCGICDEDMVLDGAEPEDEDGPVVAAPRRVGAPGPAPAPRVTVVDYTWLPKVALLTGLADLVIRVQKQVKAPKQAKRLNDTLPLIPQEEIHQCAGGDGYRLCRNYNGKWICSRCWRKRVAIAGKSR